VSVYAATRGRGRAFWWSVLSGVAEPVKALLAAVALMCFANQVLLGGLLSALERIMVFISIAELLPVSGTYGEEHSSMVGVALGMAMMSVSLWMLK